MSAYDNFGNCGKIIWELKTTIIDYQVTQSNNNLCVENRYKALSCYPIIQNSIQGYSTFHFPFQEFDYLHNFGPRFKKLADMYGEEPDSEDDEDDMPPSPHLQQQRHSHHQQPPPSESWC